MNASKSKIDQPISMLYLFLLTFSNYEEKVTINKSSVPSHFLLYIIDVVISDGQ